MATHNDNQLYVIKTEENSIGPNSTQLTFRTSRGHFHALARFPHNCRKAVLMLADEDGNLEGPCSVYSKLADNLYDKGIASLRLGYRLPGDCAQCGIDTLVAIQYLDDELISDVTLVGWSFGAAVAIAAGSVAKTVRGVVAASTISAINCGTKWLKTKPILLIHGDSDTVSPLEVAQAVYMEANIHKTFLIYPNEGHDLSNSGSRLFQDINEWVLDSLTEIRSVKV